MARNASYAALADHLIAAGEDVRLDAIYRLVCRPPHRDDLTIDELHSRCSRAIGKARGILKARGYVLMHGDLKNSYRAVRRARGATA